jgi:phage tail-like protein
MVIAIPKEQDQSTPLPTFNFHVDASLPGVNSGKPVCLGAFAEVSGLEATMEPKVIKVGGRNYGPIQRAGPVSFATVVLRRGVSEKARDLWAWWALFSGGDGAATVGSVAANRTNVTVSMIRPKKSDTGEREAVLTWTLENAMPVKFKAGDLNARGTEVAIEELHLVHEGLKVERA